MGIQVVKPGLMTTVQDIGRFGYERYGIGRSGVMDTFSYHLANYLVGNFSNEAVLEITMYGPKLLFDKSCIISICGADLTPTLNEKVIPLGKTIQVMQGDLLSFGKIKVGSHCYVAIHGGILTNDILNSKSTNVKAALGGFQGRALKKEDIIPIYESTLNSKINWRLPPSLLHFFKDKLYIRFIRGLQYDWFTEKSKLSFSSSKYTIQLNSNRMGYRTSGTQLLLEKDQDLITEGVTFGSVQVPPDGNPIILMADRQTTGGYPKIAQISSVDLPIVAQKLPGEELAFYEITLEESQRLWIKREKELLLLKRLVGCKLKGAITKYV